MEAHKATNDVNVDRAKQIPIFFNLLRIDIMVHEYGGKDILRIRYGTLHSRDTSNHNFRQCGMTKCSGWSGADDAELSAESQ